MSKSIYALILTTGLAGCASQSAIVLLPKTDGSVGALEVTSKTQPQTQALTSAYQTATVVDQRPPALETVTPEAVQRTYGAALAAQPAPPLHFTLYFASGGSELTPESQALLPQILTAVSARQSTDISVIGHADTVGEAEKNRQVSAQRATDIAAWLIQQGIPQANLEVSSHGEANLLVPTADEIAEPRNRRVEITIR